MYYAQAEDTAEPSSELAHGNGMDHNRFMCCCVRGRGCEAAPSATVLSIMGHGSYGSRIMLDCKHRTILPL